MKRNIIILAFFAICSCYANAQTINNKNYYNFLKEGGSLNWLRVSDAVPVIIDELLKNDVPYHTISIGDLIKINESTRLVVTVSFEKNDKKYGFLYEAIHGFPLNPSDRKFMTDPGRASYVQAEKDLKGDVNFMKTDPIPSNIFLFKQTVYWYQFDEKGTAYPVSKETAQAILREDIRDYLKNL